MNYREIPYNYTSTFDQHIVEHCLGAQSWEKLERLREKRVTGRSAKLLMRFMGEYFMLQRNAYLFYELAHISSKREHTLRQMTADLSIIERNAGKESDVLDILNDCKGLLRELKKELRDFPTLQRSIIRQFSRLIGRENISFMPIDIVSHSTDATDWRLFNPLVVIYPRTEEQVAACVQLLNKLRLPFIPRGGGTGLTGGAVPLVKNCVMLNTERLNTIYGLEQSDGLHLLHVQAGVITEDAMDYAKEKGFVFATDPTSAWASTIGGNIAENAGGKKAVLWGTAIDNLLEYQIVMPNGELLTIRRHAHPQHKIYSDDVVRFDIYNGNQLLRSINLSASEIRKKGLWKDITNKTLQGLPGMQKEGTDGVIVAAKFILYKSFSIQKTLCLEFFGQDMQEASEVITQIMGSFEQNPQHEVLIALEHFDDKYISAIRYRVKADRDSSPQAVLLIDVAANSLQDITSGLDRIQQIVKQYSKTEVFVAQDEEEAQRFWQDRKNLGAISAHTNAFKLNEDIVIPIEKLASFSRFTVSLNREGDVYTATQTLALIKNHIQKVSSQFELTASKVELIEQICDQASATFATTSESIEPLLNQTLSKIEGIVSNYGELAGQLKTIASQEQSVKIIVATHMHAGDGNIHVNIPVHSNNLQMMRRAEKVVDRVMEETIRIGGVVSGEHGIGITKLKYVPDSDLESFAEYKKIVDPLDLVNPKKLLDKSLLAHLYTPSFNLLELEAKILRHGSLEQLASKISKCIRCGKCKANCCVFYPQGTMFYHPRNKNLAIGALIEALLYDVQRNRSTSFALLKLLGNIADHCTLCHKCLKPCPVEIDTAVVTLLERDILKNMKYKRTAIFTQLTMIYLASTSAAFNQLFRFTILQMGSLAQRLASSVVSKLSFLKRFKSLYLYGLLSSPMAAPSPNTLRSILPATKDNQVLVLNPASPPIATVLYFPGCGSERLYSSIGEAAIYLLLKQNIRVILTPSFLCCGYPHYANSDKKKRELLNLRNTILFAQIREMFSYITFEACVVTCGTCKEQLSTLKLTEPFDAPVMDAVAYLASKGFAFKTAESEKILYHAPCHDSLDGKGSSILKKMGEYKLSPTAHCCSESGTMAISRPDISGTLRDKKAQTLTGQRVITNCPSCLQGLRRQPGTQALHLTEELAVQVGKASWKRQLKELLRRAEVITF